MKITRAQRKMLETFQGFQTDDASVMGQIRRNAAVFVYMLVVALIMAPVAFVFGRWFGAFGIGMILGMFARDIRGFMRWQKIWPAMEAVVDWPQVEALLEPGRDEE